MRTSSREPMSPISSKSGGARRVPDRVVVGDHYDDIGLLPALGGEQVGAVQLCVARDALPRLALSGLVPQSPLPMEVQHLAIDDPARRTPGIADHGIRPV